MHDTPLSRERPTRYQSLKGSAIGPRTRGLREIRRCLVSPSKGRAVPQCRPPSMKRILVLTTATACFVLSAMPGTAKLKPPQDSAKFWLPLCRNFDPTCVGYLQAMLDSVSLDKANGRAPYWCSSQNITLAQIRRIIIDKLASNGSSPSSSWRPRRSRKNSRAPRHLATVEKTAHPNQALRGLHTN